MDYRKLAEDELRHVEELRAAEKVCQDRLSDLNDQMRTTKSTFSSTTPVQGGGSRTEDHWLSLIASKSDEEKRLKTVRRRLRRFNTAWDVLGTRDQSVLEVFYIRGGKGAAERFAGLWYCDRATAFRWRDEALVCFTRAFYGEVVT